MIRDKDLKEQLVEELNNLLDHAEIRDDLAKSIKKLGHKDAALHIVEEIKRLVS
jgi:UDP-N-acetylglucosamine:LPS N-acetylglucosamine transferase